MLSSFESSILPQNNYLAISGWKNRIVRKWIARILFKFPTAGELIVMIICAFFFFTGTKDANQ